MPTNPQSAPRSALLVGLLLLAGCSTLPSTQSGSGTFSVFNSATKPAPVRPLAVTAPELTLPPEWLTIESTVVSLGEQDLFDRMRMGFALENASANSIDNEEAWYASHPDYLDRTFRRGERYLYYIVSELEARKMPLELALLPVVESAFNPVALSTAKAAGLWQFIPSTGTRFGLKQNNYYDGRRDVVESTRAALDYLQFLANEFDGDWLLAIAAYNTGEANVARAIQRNIAKGKPTDFFSLDLPRETEAYVPKLLAMRRIVSDPLAHGLEFGSLENQPYFVKVDAGGQIDLGLAAELAGMSKEDFLAINPGYKGRVTDPNGPHQLLIPVANEQSFLEKLASLPSAQRVPMVYYRVRKGDTLNKVAQRYGLATSDIVALNNLKTKSIKPGQELLLRGATAASAIASTSTEIETAPASKAASKTPAKSKTTYTVRSGDTLWSIAQRYEVDPTVLASLNGIKKNAIKTGQKLKIPGSVATTSKSEVTQEKLSYTVRSGDTLSRIAGQFKVEVKQLMNWNKLSSAADLKAGQRLVVYTDDSRRAGG
ncbi:MAG: LysM peptidoglycan-binding domain-containing protein [Steroidobacteraceae bacterium]